jgi:hypothetical protein
MESPFSELSGHLSLAVGFSLTFLSVGFLK